ncbi:nitroreductase family protein [Pandoraea anapnoica]|nr:nitroreductase family protein [Pandoraea anapnoica]
MNDLHRFPYEIVPAPTVPIAVTGSPDIIDLPSPDLGNGASLMVALARRRTTREFSQASLSSQQLGDLLWAANGINRADTGGRTAPSAHDVHEIDIYAALPEGVYLYDPMSHELRLKRAVDARNLTGYQDFVGGAPLDLVYVVNHFRADRFPAEQRDTFAGVAIGAISQNVSLYCAAVGLACVVRGWLNPRLLADAMTLNDNEIPVLAQTIGHAAVTV